MSRDDYISKLFIDNQDKLNQAPSMDLWSKLEANLDEQLPTADTPAPPKILSLSRYFAAASVLVAVMGSVYLFDLAQSPENKTMAVEIVLDEEPIAMLEDEAEPYQDEEVMPASEVKAEEAKELHAQETKIVEAVNEKVQEEQLFAANTTTDAKIVIEDIELKGDVPNDAANSVIVIETEEEETPMTPQMNTVTNSAYYYQNDEPLVQNTTRNYANAVPQISNQNNSTLAESVVANQEKAAVKQESASNSVAANKSAVAKRKKARRGIINKKEKSRTKVKYRSPMATANARLQPFGFLLGKWRDYNEKDGKSYEVWTLKSSNVLIGRGYMLSNDGDRIFEEIIEIGIQNGQIFLTVSLDEDQKMSYMLSKFDTERFVFTQSESSRYPDKVIIQQNLDGYQIIISNQNDFLTPEQQRYLDNRNRVSNMRAARTMSAE